MGAQTKSEVHMSREDMLYQILYSHHLEKMFSVITGRIDKCLSFLLFLLGSSVIAGLGYPVLIGLLIAGISAIKMAFHFEAAAEHSRKQAAVYLRMYTTQNQFTTDLELQNAIADAQDGDHNPWPTLNYPAMVAAQIELGRQIDTELGFIEKFLSLIGGISVKSRQVENKKPQ
jgi:hypothetical protein